MIYEILDKKINLSVLVSSDSVPGAFYKVKAEDDIGVNVSPVWTCTCPSFTMSALPAPQCYCKHIKFIISDIEL